MTQLCIIILGIVADISANPWDEFMFAVELDVAGKYWMFCTPDDETQTITFEVNEMGHQYQFQRSAIHSLFTSIFISN